MCLLYGVAMKEQTKPSKVNTVLLVIIILLNLAIGWVVIGTTLDTNARVAGIEDHMVKQTDLFQRLQDVFEEFGSEIEKINAQ